MKRRPSLLPCFLLYYSPGEIPILACPPTNKKPQITVITDDEAQVLALCQGEFTLADIAARLKMDQRLVKAIAEKFSREPNPSIEFIEAVETPPSPAPHMEIAMEILSELDSADKFVGNGGQLYEYHTGQITDAIEQFESHETTLSYLYSQPHPALGGLSYGSRLAERFCKTGVMQGCSTILEIGGGTGFLARDFLGYLKQHYPEIFQNLCYVLLELSPILLRSQRDSTSMYSETVAQVLGDALTLPFTDGTFSLIIANEMIADVPSVCIEREWLNNNARHQISTEARLALEFIRRFNIQVEDAFPQFLVNLGAWQLLKDIHRLLIPGGVALITEYGSYWRYPVAVYLPDHTEYAVHFGHLEEIATRMGFDVRLERLADFLKMDLEISILERISLTTLNQSLLPYLNSQPLPLLAFTPEMLEQHLGRFYPHIYNLRFSSPKKGGCQGDPSVFYALTIEKKA